MPPVYDGNPKHKEPWQRGRCGGLCPSRRDMPELDPQSLLDNSLPCGEKRYAVYDGMPFAAQCHRREQDLWHGYPVGYNEVPESVWRQWLNQKLIAKRHLRRFRTDKDVEEYICGL